MKKFSMLLTIVLGISLICAFAGPKTVKGKAAFVPGEVIVKFADSANKTDIKGRYSLTKLRDSHKPGAFTVFGHGNPTAILKQLKNEPGVLSAEQNGYSYALAVPNDTYYSPYQWHMTRIGMEAAWDITTGSSSVVVAVVDSGVKQSLEDLSGTTFMAGYDFVNGDSDPTDDEGHGSHVCGTIAQTTNNNTGCVGIAYNTTIMPVKVLNKRGSGTWDQIANGIYYAADNGAHIINMSLGGGYSTLIDDACTYAWNNGVLIICAAGNSSTSDPMYPAAQPLCVSVSATNYLDELAGYSNYGSTIDICAPGGDGDDNNGDGYMDGVLQNTFLRRTEGYYFYTGTSMASPHVAGVAALVKAVNSSLTNTQIRSILEGTAEDLGASGWDQYFGHGIVDALAAVQAAQ
ncbi:MAG: peptidase S8 [Candidatus Aminicenantes bacterium]|nr:peptidase S8 [Candidatus Aminicenantes bacterium]